MALRISAALQAQLVQVQKSDIAISLVKWIYLNILPLHLISVWAVLQAVFLLIHLFLKTIISCKRKMSRLALSIRMLEQKRPLTL